MGLSKVKAIFKLANRHQSEKLQNETKKKYEEYKAGFGNNIAEAELANAVSDMLYGTLHNVLGSDKKCHLYDELEQSMPDLYTKYKGTGITAASLVMFNENARNKLTNEQIGNVIRNEWLQTYGKGVDSYYSIDLKRISKLFNCKFSYADLSEYEKTICSMPYSIARYVNEKIKRHDKQHNYGREENLAKYSLNSIEDLTKE